jgi:chaperonin GroES
MNIITYNDEDTMLDTFRPLRDRLLVERVAEEEVTAGGIIKPDTAKQKGQKGKVLAVGPGKKDEHGNLRALHVKQGDVIYFAKYAGTELDDDHLVLNEDDVLGIIAK